MVRDSLITHDVLQIEFAHIYKICGLTLKVPEKLQLYELYVYYVVHICDFGMLRVKACLPVFDPFAVLHVTQWISSKK